MKSRATILTIICMVVFAMGLFLVQAVTTLAQENDTTVEASGVAGAAEASEALIKKSSAGLISWAKNTYSWLDNWRLEKAEDISGKIKGKRMEYEDAKKRRNISIEETLDENITSEKDIDNDEEKAAAEEVDNFLSQPFILGAYVITLEIIYFVLVTKVLFFALLGLIALHLARSAVLVIVA